MDIYNFIRSLKVNVLVEIGSHFGEDTLKFKQIHPFARIVAFEPDPRNIKIIRESKIDRLCEFYPIALSDKNEQRPFFMSSGSVGQNHTDPQHRENDWSSSSSLKKPTGHLDAHKWITFPNTAMVDCRRLDDIPGLKDTIVDFMWVDVQGAEDIVFSGGKETLARTRYVYTEYGTDLYEGQMNRDHLIGFFGPNWSVVHDYGGDILLKNISM